MKETKWPEQLGDTIKALMELTPEKAALPMYALLCNIYRMEPKILGWRDKAKQLDELVEEFGGDFADFINSLEDEIDRRKGDREKAEWWDLFVSSFNPRAEGSKLSAEDLLELYRAREASQEVLDWLMEISENAKKWDDWGEDCKQRIIDQEQEINRLHKIIVERGNRLEAVKDYIKELERAAGEEAVELDKLWIESVVERLRSAVGIKE